MTRSAIDQRVKEIRTYCNRAQFEKAHTLSKRLLKRYPEIPDFTYYEAVLSAEDDTGYTPAEVRTRHRAAARKLRKLLYRIRSAPPELRSAIRNEYYWFSHQPHKQFLLGKEQVKRGEKRAYYSQGVGAVELAKRYGLAGRKKLCLRWAKRGEQAWLNFFKIDSDWFNSYFFYAAALGYQGRTSEMDAALKRAAKISKKPMSWQAIKGVRVDIERVLRAVKTQE